jgi:hypothetical protein
MIGKHKHSIGAISIGRVDLNLNELGSCKLLSICEHVFIEIIYVPSAITTFELSYCPSVSKICKSICGEIRKVVVFISRSLNAFIKVDL